MLQNIDVCQAARASRTACEQVFRNIVPNSDGKLVLRFTGGFEPSQKTDQALIHAIEILPETRQTVRIDAGSDASFVDWNGYIWSTDGNFQGGSAIRSDAPLTSASPTLLRPGALSDCPQWKIAELLRTGVARCIHGPSEVRRAVAE